MAAELPKKMSIEDNKLQRLLEDISNIHNPQEVDTFIHILDEIKSDVSSFDILGKFASKNSPVCKLFFSKATIEILDIIFDSLFAKQILGSFANIFQILTTLADNARSRELYISVVEKCSVFLRILASKQKSKNSFDNDSDNADKSEVADTIGVSERSNSDLLIIQMLIYLLYRVIISSGPLSDIKILVPGFSLANQLTTSYIESCRVQTPNEMTDLLAKNLSPTSPSTETEGLILNSTKLNLDDSRFQGANGGKYSLEFQAVQSGLKMLYSVLSAVAINYRVGDKATEEIKATDSYHPWRTETLSLSSVMSNPLSLNQLSLPFQVSLVGALLGLLSDAVPQVSCSYERAVLTDLATAIIFQTGIPFDDILQQPQRLRHFILLAQLNEGQYRTDEVLRKKRLNESGEEGYEKTPLSSPVSALVNNPSTQDMLTYLDTVHDGAGDGAKVCGSGDKGMSAQSYMLNVLSSSDNNPNVCYSNGNSNSIISSNSESSYSDSSLKSDINPVQNLADIISWESVSETELRRLIQIKLARRSTLKRMARASKRYIKKNISDDGDGSEPSSCGIDDYDDDGDDDDDDVDSSSDSFGLVRIQNQTQDDLEWSSVFGVLKHQPQGTPEATLRSSGANIDASNVAAYVKV